MGSIVMTEIKVDNIVNVAGTGKPNFPVSPTHSTGSALSTLNRYQYDTTTRVVTVVSDGGNKYAIDGVTTPTITLLRGVTYTFDVSDSSNSNHPLAFKNAGTPYTTGITSSGTAGTAGATVTFTVTASAPLTGLTYYCTVHGDSMGSSVTTSDPRNGAMLWDGTNVNFYLDSAFKAVSAGSGSSATFENGGDRAVVLGGYTTDEVDTIDYFDMTTSGNATDFGNAIYASISGATGTDRSAGVSNKTRGVYLGSNISTNNNGAQNEIQYITFATTGNATDFGDMNVKRARMGACSDGSRGLAWGGDTNTSESFEAGYPYSGSTIDDIQYITIATLGNSTTFGDFSGGQQMAAAANATYGLGGGGTGNTGSTIEYVTIQTLGNATSFGNLPHGFNACSATADATRAIWWGNSNNTNNQWENIVYYTIATPGNSTDFGDLSTKQTSSSSCCNGTVATLNGGYDTASRNWITKITVQTTGNATDHGDLTLARRNTASASGNAS